MKYSNPTYSCCMSVQSSPECPPTYTVSGSRRMIRADRRPDRVVTIIRLSARRHGQMPALTATKKNSNETTYRRIMYVLPRTNLLCFVQRLRVVARLFCSFTAPPFPGEDVGNTVVPPHPPPLRKRRAFAWAQAKPHPRLFVFVDCFLPPGEATHAQVAL